MHVTVRHVDFAARKILKNKLHTKYSFLKNNYDNISVLRGKNLSSGSKYIYLETVF